MTIGSGLAVGFLITVILALFAAGLFGLFGKPVSHTGRKRKQNVRSGFAIGGGIVLGAILMGVLVVGLGVALGSISPSQRLSRPVAGLLALLSITLIFLMIRHWARHFAGWIGYGVLNGVRMVISGHALNSPSVNIPRWWSVSATLLMILTAQASFRFVRKQYQLSSADKVGLMTWPVGFAVAINIQSTRLLYRDQIGLAIMALSTLSLIFAWWHGHVSRSKRHSGRATHASPSETP